MGFPRLVYSPKAYVYVKDSNNQIRDLSAYVSAGSVSRKINQISTAEITLRNPDMIFTDRKTGALLLPMDPITIYLQRLRSRPVRVFTGFLDQTPWLQLYPGTVTLKASCTLKKLLYTFFDPALPYVNDFLQQYGWLNNGQGEIINPAALSHTYNAGSDPRENPTPTDGSIGNLLFATLKHIGNWGPDTIYIDKLPQQLPARIAQLAREFEEDNAQAKTDFEQLMRQIIGQSSFGSGGGTSDATKSGPIAGEDAATQAIVKIADKNQVPADMAIAVALIESGLGTNMFTHEPFHGWYQQSIKWPPYGSDGTMGNHTPSIEETQDLGIACAAFCSAAAARARRDPSLRKDTLAWAMNTQGVNSHNNPRYPQTWNAQIAKAQSLISKYGGALTPVTPGKEQNTKSVFDSPPGTKYKGMTRYDAIVAEANRLNQIHTNYSNARPPGDNVGYDCSSTCADLMRKAGYNVPYFNTATAPSYMLPGEDPTGRVTFWNDDRGHTAGDTVHIFVTIGGRDFGTSRSNPGGGPGWADHPKDGFSPFHIKGLDEPADVPKNADTGVPAGSSDSQGDVPSASGTDQMYSVAQATAFAAQLQWPTIEDTIEAIGLQGQKSLMNDKPLMPFIEQLTDASLRQFQSMPNGNFYAFYPDYFGEFGRKPYWMINDIEILDGGFDINDEALATHVYVVGDTIPGGIDQLDRLFSGGVVSIFNAFMAGQGVVDHKTGKGPEKFTELIDKSDAVKFLQRYGARPQLFEEPMVRSPYFEAFLAYQKFMLLWSRQFLTTFTFTFMPELFPGGKVGIPEHGIQAYIEEVEHTWDYTSGFFTQANLTAPSVLPGTSTEDLPPNMVTQQSLYEPIKHETLVKSPLGGSFPVTPSPDALVPVR